jgi:Domain of unknown function (DUF1839)
MNPLAPGAISLIGVDPSTYEGHPVHAPSRAYPETNCYADILIELLHARGDEPLAALGSTVRGDFEGDQFTFFKPPLGELESLFGVDIHEMQPYRPVPQQAAEQLAFGRTLIVELDSYYLPDTAATSYRAEHVKSSVIIESVDVAGHRLRYFHNTGLYDLDGDDFRGAFRVGRDLDPELLPPYTELVRFDAGPRLAGDALRATARDLLGHHLARRPVTNPFGRFGAQLAEQLPDLIAGETEGYHAYAFATVRMAGSAFELAASYVTWLLPDAGGPAAGAFGRIVEGCKRLSFKLARRRTFDPDPAVAALASAWTEAQELLDAAVR